MTRDLLAKYGQHTADCATRTELQFDTGKMGDCDCGFADALKGETMSDAEVQAAIKDAQYINDLRSQYINDLRSQIQRLEQDKEQYIKRWRDEQSVKFGWKDACMAANHAHNRADARAEVLTAALESIARNSCCGLCREAGLVAKAALARVVAMRSERLPGTVSDLENGQHK